MSYLKYFWKFRVEKIDQQSHYGEIKHLHFTNFVLAKFDPLKYLTVQK